MEFFPSFNENKQQNTVNLWALQVGHLKCTLDPPIWVQMLLIDGASQ